jgi:hypothetical protein
MGRRSTLDILPVDVRDELDRRLVVLRTPQIVCLSWLRELGYTDISSSALNRYAIKLMNGAEGLKLLTVHGQPLGQVVAEHVTAGDPHLGELVSELIDLQLRAHAALTRIRRHLYDRHREADAKRWAEERAE